MKKKTSMLLAALPAFPSSDGMLAKRNNNRFRYR